MKIVGRYKQGEVTDVELTKGQKECIEFQKCRIGLVMAYYEKLGDDAFDIAKAYFSQVGMTWGQDLKRSLKVEGNDENALAAVLNAFLVQAVGMPEGSAEVQGNQVIVENKDFCSVLEAVQQLNAPWEKVCHNCALPIFEGVALAVNPDTTLEVPKSRMRGNRHCKHVFTIHK